MSVALTTSPSAPAGEAGRVRRLIQSEFEEMPGMRLTIPQARRLWALSEDRCTLALEELAAAGFLVRDDYGRYARAHGLLRARWARGFFPSGAE